MISGINIVWLKVDNIWIKFDSIDPRKSSYKHYPKTQKNFSGENNKVKEFRKLVISTYQFEHLSKLEEVMINHTLIEEIWLMGNGFTHYWKEPTTLLVRTFIPIKPGDESRVIFSVQLEKEALSNIY